VLISSSGRSRVTRLLLTGLASIVLRTVVSAQDPESRTLDVVAVAIIDEGRAVLLATRGLPTNKDRWRFRSLDTTDLPQPIRYVQPGARSRERRHVGIRRGAGHRLALFQGRSRRRALRAGAAVCPGTRPSFPVPSMPSKIWRGQRR